MKRRTQLSGFLLAGITLYAVLWEVAGQAQLFGSAWPPLSTVLRTMLSERYEKLLLHAIGYTLGEAAIGYLIGMAMAIMLVAATLFIPILWKSVNHLAVFANALPPIVLGPLLLATMPRSEAPVVLSALVVTLTLFISLSTGLATTQAAHRDYFTVAGASRLTRMLRLEVPSAIPTFVDGLKMAAPAALLGAILAEWFGAERGIGPIFVAAMQNYQTELLWAAALTCALASVLIYALLSLLQHFIEERFQ